MNKVFAFHRVSSLLRSRRRTLAVFVGVAVLFALVLAMLLPPRYEGRVVIMAAQPEDYRGGLAALAGQFADLADLAGMGLESKSDIELSLAVLTSREFTNRFLVEENVLPELFPEMWDKDKHEWKAARRSLYRVLMDPISNLAASISGDTAAQRKHADGPGPSLWDAYKRFDRLRSISRDRRTGVIVVSVRWRDPELASRWANQLVVRANDALRAEAVRESEEKQQYLADQLDKTLMVELRQVLFKISESEQRKAMVAAVRKEYAFRIIDPAVVPKERVSPKRTVLVVSMALLGLFLGAAYLLVGELLRTRHEVA